MSEFLSKILKHTKQILLVTFFDTTAGNGISFQTHGQTNEQMNGWTGTRGS